jgi:hypothetical protein
MANQNQNLFSIDGVLFKKNSRTVAGKKDPTQTYTFNSINLEIKSTRETTVNGKVQYITLTEFPEFECVQGINLEEFNVGDFLTVRFAISGKEFVNKNKEKQIITKLRAVFLKFATLDNDVRPITHKAEPVKEEVFKAPDPMDNNDEFGDLPFIITILLGLSTLMPFMV